MKEIRDIIQAYDLAQQQGKRTALATLVHAEGSSYRRPGARMLITEDGLLVGAISGGCLEGDALRKALLVMIEQRPVLVTYDTMDEDDATLGIGLDCNGIIQVLIEPVIDADLHNPIQHLKSLAADRQTAVLVTLFSLSDKKSTQHGTRLLLKEDQTIVGSSPVLNEILLEDAKQVLSNQASVFRNYVSEGINVTAFMELVKPSVSVVIFGAGNDVMPMVQMADILGWETTVIDGRASYAKQERFQSACQVLVAKPEEALEKIAIDQQTVFVLMTHNYNYDLAILRRLVEKDVVYVGMLGPRKKFSRMLEELKEEGIELNNKQLSFIHSPVGLDIGAESSEEIALSILTEIKAMFTGRLAQPLRDKSEVIHSRSESVIEKVRIS